MTIRRFFRVLYSEFFILLIALGLISIALSLHQKEPYLNLIIGLLVLLSAIVVVVSLITINRKINVPGGV
jgi:hypothetical protein